MLTINPQSCGVLSLGILLYGALRTLDYRQPAGIGQHDPGKPAVIGQHDSGQPAVIGQHSQDNDLCFANINQAIICDWPK
jgi:hypothetical protein